ncbi:MULTISPECIES: hypothetical protein [unclassified Bosea (in: a-proteobacteria)]|uniref:hypothetical protein n=1 Tax=unclassified Bosea (in: a-proteobacteria) TaxID=2653178 RepID=UPI00125F76B8|nr:MULTISPECIES: hypothetical protein [unclassified Bosea (in: a-proteobacteria)]
MRYFHPHLMRIIAASALTLALSACASTPDPIVEDRSRCDAYGFQRGTDAYANCVMTQDRDRDRRYERQAGQRISRAERPYSSEEE